VNLHLIICCRLTGEDGQLNQSRVSKITLENNGKHVVLPILTVKGKRGKKVFVVAGHHGTEHTSIQIAHRLFDYLMDARDLRADVTIIPMANVEGIRKELRGNPLDGKVITTCYPGLAQGSSSERIAFEIWKRAKDSDCILDLHSAGHARYVQHVIFHDKETFPLLRTFGFDFAIRRSQGKEGKGGSLAAEARRQGILAFSLELGGGHIVFLEDVDSGLRAILSFLRSLGCLPSARRTRLTSLRRIYMHDARVFARSPVDGVVYLHCELNDKILKGMPLATCIDLTSLRRYVLKSPASGRIVYLRTKSRIGHGETVAMILPLFSSLGADVA